MKVANSCFVRMRAVADVRESNPTTMSAAIEKPIRTATVARIYRLCWFAALAPLGYWLLSWLVPTRVLVDGATLSDTLLWQHLKPTFLSGCSDGCRHIA